MDVRLDAVCARRRDPRSGTEVDALRDVSLTFRAGELAVVAGANGSGKSVLGLVAAGALPIRSGKISVDGRPLTHGPWPDVVGILLQNVRDQLLERTVAADVRLSAQNAVLATNPLRAAAAEGRSGGSRRDDGGGVSRGEARTRLRREKRERDAQLEIEISRATQSALVQLQLDHLQHRDPWALSGGEQRRVALAGAIVAEPPILFLDEPFTGLDYPGVCILRELIEALHQAGRGVVVATHAVRHVYPNADRIILLSSGQVVFDGSPHCGEIPFARYGVEPPPTGESGR